MTLPPNRDFLPTASWANLRLRAQLLQKLRHFFESRGYLEVDTPLLSADTVIDRHLDPFETRFVSDPRQPEIGPTLYLQTSPELAMKRLLAAGGEGALFQVTRGFRNGEFGPRHNPEFTIVEWYRVGDDLDAQMTLVSDLSHALLGTEPAERLTYLQAFQTWVGIDPHRASISEMLAAAVRLNLIPPPNMPTDDRDAWLDWLLVECIEPNLGATRPTLLHDYPPSQAALAVVRTGDPPVAERFEWYIRGIELCNGYHELLDANALRVRQDEQNVWRVRDGKPALPNQQRLLAAMDFGLPACSGVAMGFDRIVMLAAGTSAISDVIPFPYDRA